MALDGAEAGAGAPVPDLDRRVHAAGDELHGVEPEAADAPGVADERADALARVEVPDLDAPVPRAGHEDAPVEAGQVLLDLEARDGVRVALEDRDGAGALAPVAFEREPLRVDALPRPGRRGGGRRLAVAGPDALVRTGRLEIVVGVVVLVVVARDGHGHVDRAARDGADGGGGGEDLLLLGRARLGGRLLVRPPALLHQREAPAALFALALNVLLAHCPPEQVVVGELLPGLGHLGAPAEADGVDVREHVEGDLLWQDGERVDPADVLHALGQVRELARAADGEQAGEHEAAAGGVAAAEEGPDGVDGLLVGGRHGLERELERPVGALVGHALVAGAEASAVSARFAVGHARMDAGAADLGLGQADRIGRGREQVGKEGRRG